MKSKLFFLSTIIALLTYTGSLFAQPLVTVDELVNDMKDKNTVVIYAGTAKNYAKEHIKGAINIAHTDLYKASGVKSMLLSDADLAKKLGEAGVSNTSKIRVYDNGSFKYAGRMYWILKYLGATDVKILNGGINAWKNGRKPVTAMATKGKKTTFSSRVKSDFIAQLSEVKSPGANAVIVDVRPEDEYTKGDKEYTGHVPGAINLHFQDFINGDGTLKTKAQIEFKAKRAGVTPDKKVILYCTSSVRAGIVFLALHDIAGYTNVKVFDGALYQWVDSGNKVD